MRGTASLSAGEAGAHNGGMISRSVDLNLLVQLDVLLAERSVTGAARRPGQSQPTLSGALAKLRRHFDDQLLVRSGVNAS